MFSITVNPALKPASYALRNIFAKVFLGTNFLKSISYVIFREKEVSWFSNINSVLENSPKKKSIGVKSGERDGQSILM